MFRTHWSPWSCRRMCPFCSLPNRATPLNLLSSIAARRARLSSWYSSTFTPFSQCSTPGPVDDDPARVELAGGLHRPVRRGEDVVERRGLAFGHAASACFSSSMIWYTCPIAESMSSRMKCSPLLPPGETFHSNVQLEPIEGGGGDRVEARRACPAVVRRDGKHAIGDRQRVLDASGHWPRHPFRVLPSKSSIHPARFSASVNWFGAALTGVPADVAAAVMTVNPSPSRNFLLIAPASFGVLDGSGTRSSSTTAHR